MQKVKDNQNGFTMIELLIAVTLMALVLLTVGAAIAFTSGGFAMVQRKRDAENYVVEVSAKLKAQQRANQVQGGAFAVEAASGLPVRNADGEVALNCSADFCDRVIVFPSDTVGTSPRQAVIGWNEPLPDGSTVKFIRAWTITDEDALRSWRRISIALFVPDSNTPTTFSVTGAVIK